MKRCSLSHLFVAASVAEACGLSSRKHYCNLERQPQNTGHLHAQQTGDLLKK